MTPYDHVPYTSKAVPLADPDRMAVVARVLGRDPPRVDTARVLEIGCASGGHLLPLAAARPHATFLGFDAAATQIAAGERARAALGLDNLALRTLDLRDDAPLGTFDYVIAHGVFSWVPDDLRARLLARIAEVLAPDGVAYVSFNCRPGWHARGELRGMLLEELVDRTEPAERVARARAHVAWLAAHAASNPWGEAIRAEARLLGTVDDAVFFHDILAPVNDPFSLSAFVARLAPHGLAYLGDADFGSMLPDRLPAPLRSAVVGDAVAGDAVATESAIDRITGRSFRQALLIRPAPIDRHVTWARLEGLVPWAILSATPDGWRTRRGDLVTGSPTLTPALDALAHKGVAGVPFDGDPVVGANLLAAWVRGAVGLSTMEVPSPSEPPVARPVTRWEAAHASAVANLRHEPYTLDDTDRALLVAADGTRDTATLRRLAPPGRDRVAHLAAHGFLT